MIDKICKYTHDVGVCKSVFSRGMCQMHYTRYMKHGDALHTKKHGKSKTPEYRLWSDIKSRCFNSNIDQYSDYGGRGILMCKEWVSDFMCFYKYLEDTIGLLPNKDLSIDRIDVNKGYEPGNIRWADRITQARNRRVESISQSKCKGVTLEKSSGKWVVRIGLKPDVLFLGKYKELSEAIKIRLKAELYYWGEVQQKHLLNKYPID